MHLFFLIFFLLLLISAIFFTIFEINFVKNFLKIENIVLLRILETMTPFVTLLIASRSRAILKSVFSVFCFLCFSFIMILIIEFFRKKINMRELIINSVLCFIDIFLVIIGIVVIFRF